MNTDKEKQKQAFQSVSICVHLWLKFLDSFVVHSWLKFLRDHVFGEAPNTATGAVALPFLIFKSVVSGLYFCFQFFRLPRMKKFAFFGQEPGARGEFEVGTGAVDLPGSI